MAKDSESCPPLGAGSVDIHALHTAAKRGNDMAKALDGATTKPKPVEKAKAESAPAPTTESKGD